MQLPCDIQFHRALTADISQLILFQKQIADIVKLFHFVFPERHGPLDILHRLLLDYVAWNMPSLQKDASSLEF